MARENGDVKTSTDLYGCASELITKKREENAIEVDDRPRVEKGPRREARTDCLAVCRAVDLLCFAVSGESGRKEGLEGFIPYEGEDRVLFKDTARCCTRETC